MEIEILISLKDNPIQVGVGHTFVNQGLAVSEIEVLEQAWNSGNQFPKSLRELLYLAGNFCYVLDYSIWQSQQEMQDELRNEMQEDGNILNRPFYIIDNYASDQFLFVYLDEDQIDPMVYSYTSDAISRERALDEPMGYTLSHLINLGIEAVKEGRNPM
ncbi:MAG TPA: hypothetical protein VFF15_00485 [Flavobacteriaceae bacterium]|nr:hypothetical protein [Flavobacteriaceae bacterium]